MNRRSVLTGIAGLTTAGAANLPSEAECKVTTETDESLADVADPDFTIESSEKTHKFYWRPSEHFRAKYPDLVVFGYATLDGDEVMLNERFYGNIGYDTIAHEIGHNLGYRHVSGSIMTSDGTQTDCEPDTPLHDVTVDVCESCSFTSLFGWDIADLASVAEDYGAGDASMNTLSYASERYSMGDVQDVYYDSNVGGGGVGYQQHDYAKFYRC